jgi:chemotaxis signal transduction protein
MALESSETFTHADSAPRAESRPLVVAGQLRLLLSYTESREYVDALVLTKVPRSPPWLLGIFGANGVAVPLIDLDAWAHGTVPKPQNHYRALRLGDAGSAWAIALDAAPSVIDLSQASSQAVSNRLPMHISSSNGHLMPHVSHIWTLHDKRYAAQVRWAALAAALKQELAGAGLA